MNDEHLGIALTDAATLPKGFRATGVHCGLKPELPDLALFVSDEPADVAGTFELGGMYRGERLQIGTYDGKPLMTPLAALVSIRSTDPERTIRILSADYMPVGKKMLSIDEDVYCETASKVRRDRDARARSCVR